MGRQEVSELSDSALEEFVKR